MDSVEFRKRGYEMIDYIADYVESLGHQRVTPDVEPGYLRELLPEEPPAQAEDWNEIMEDVKSLILPGVTHWQHTGFHAYYPIGNSFASILYINERYQLRNYFSFLLLLLLYVFLFFAGKMLGLPEHFLFSGSDSRGGGVIQSSASECVFVSIVAARDRALRQLKEEFPDEEQSALQWKLVAYCSKEAHSCAPKGAAMASIRLRLLDPDESFSLRGKTLRKAMEEDQAAGLVPFYVGATLGTMATCAFDNIEEIGPLCAEFGVWLHVDAAYAGTSFICPELRGPMKGIEFVTSFNMSPHKLMLVSYECAVMWVKDRDQLTQSMFVDSAFLQDLQSTNVIDYRHWGISLGRRFRALKLWCVIRCYGLEGLQDHVQNHCRLAQRFRDHVLADDRFEVCAPVRLGLVCFRLKAEDDLNEKLLATINESGKLFMVPASLNEKYVIRFCVCAEKTTDKHIDEDWKIITQLTDDVLRESQKEAKERQRSSWNVGKARNHKRSFFVHKTSSIKMVRAKSAANLKEGKPRRLPRKMQPNWCSCS
ncbi:aromatic-L-amino-acid decarboxylase-like [Oratosquilla oratoria]|uniref:aromatic-L-amino-acid decarboxylase-like n=1 Tax=Oratosquilla oratoria TaxID=337810 RepID=UPI003F76ED6A